MPATLPGSTWLRSAPRRHASSLAQPSTRRLPRGCTARAAATRSTFSNSPAPAGSAQLAARGEAVVADVEVPAAVAVALAEETGLLSDGARLVLQGAAVAGDPFEPDLAAAAAAVPEVVALEAVDELLRFDLVRRTEVPRRFRFRHPLVRRAVYESTPAGLATRCARPMR